MGERFRSNPFLMVVFIFIVIAILCVSEFLYASNEIIVVKGSPVYTGEAYGPNIAIPDNEFGMHDLLIVSRQGNYFWRNNGDLVLNKIEKTIQNEKGKNIDLTIFIDPLGGGQIIIRHMVSNQDDSRLSCDQGYNNYIEYRLNQYGRLTFYTGETRPYPYPKPHLCRLPGNIFPRPLDQ